MALVDGAGDVEDIKAELSGKGEENEFDRQQTEGLRERKPTRTRHSGEPFERGKKTGGRREKKTGDRQAKKRKRSAKAVAVGTGTKLRWWRLSEDLGNTPKMMKNSPRSKKKRRNLINQRTYEVGGRQCLICNM